MSEDLLRTLEINNLSDKGIPLRNDQYSEKLIQPLIFVLGEHLTIGRLLKIRLLACHLA
jgi:hypothetical protein